MSPTDLFDTGVDLAEMGRRMDQARESAGLSVFELAISTVISESLLRRYLKGETEPGAKRLARIAEVLGVSADWLIQNTDNPVIAGALWKPGDPERRANPPRGGASPPEDSQEPPARSRRPRRRSA